MKKYILIFVVITSTILFISCEAEFETYTESAGDADFSNFIAVGDSYTAGYTDGALGKRGQECGFAYILSRQIGDLDTTSFIQPLVTSGGSIGTTELADGVYNGYYQLEVSDGALTPVPSIGDETIYSDRLYDSASPIRNLGVPGAKVSHLLYPGYSTLNPYYARFASSSEASVISDALALNPSFVSLWIGGNDVLTYALEGGESDEVTDSQSFATYLNMLAGYLFSGNTKGVIANIPDINDLPYFNYILSSGFVAFYIEDENVEGGVRVLKEGEKVLLNASAAISQGYGLDASQPLDSKYILDTKEIDVIENAISSYNETIKTIADEYNLAFVDLNSLMEEAGSTGVTIDGNIYTADFISGGVFSLDGIHATGKGSAIIANAFISAINEQYDASIPLANVNEYEGIVFP